MSHLQCTNCHEIEARQHIPTEKLWSADFRTYTNYLVCGFCHDREAGFESVYTCDDCEELSVFPEDGYDLCAECYAKHMSLERELVSIERSLSDRESKYHEERNGIE